MELGGPFRRGGMASLPLVAIARPRGHRHYTRSRHLFFLRGLNLVSRTLPYWKTRRLIRKLGMHPTWWNTGAGYLLIDERQGSWIINGTAGMIVDIKRLHGHSDWQMHRLDLYTTDTPKPTASYGFGSAEEIREAAKIFQKAYAPQEKETFPSHSRTYGKKKTKPPKRIENESFPMKTRSSL